MRIRKPHPTRRQLIDMRRLHLRMPIAANIAVQVVTDDEKDVFLFGARFVLGEKRWRAEK